MTAHVEEQPNLGLATTEQLLRELAARGEVEALTAKTEQRRVDATLLWTLPAHLLSWLPRSLLDYRTVGSR